MVSGEDVGDTAVRLDQIKARLGSIAPSRMATLPKSVQRLLEVDMPKLIEIVETANVCLVRGWCAGISVSLCHGMQAIC